MVKHFIHDESGASVLEYAFIASIISIVAIVVMRRAGTQISETFHVVGSHMSSS